MQSRTFGKAPPKPVYSKPIFIDAPIPPAPIRLPRVIVLPDETEAAIEARARRHEWESAQ